MSEYGPQPEQSREEIAAKLREVIVKNQDVLNTVPEEKSVDEYWETLREKGMPVTLRIRELDGIEREQPGMYILDEQAGSVEMTYFVEDGVGEQFSIEIDRIQAIH